MLQATRVPAYDEEVTRQGLQLTIDGMSYNLRHTTLQVATYNLQLTTCKTPLIFDPMSTMLFGYASCTGISIL